MNDSTIMLPFCLLYQIIAVDNYVTLDVSAGYDWQKFSLLCKLSNSTNELNYTIHENYSANPIAPRQIMAILRYKI
ncbi:hypothetical protein ACRASX_00785 [Flavobacterium sp. TMP13]|uniref:hypothetical protein n=1 Tax=Flavobacterium sp. TMP13 TaxID=3425950 RepID=UPI003D78A7BA